MHAPGYTNVSEDTMNIGVVNIASTATSDVIVCHYGQQVFKLKVALDLAIVMVIVIHTTVTSTDNVTERVNYLNFIIFYQD